MSETPHPIATPSPAAAGSAPPVLMLLTGLLCDERVWAPVEAELDGLVETRILSFAGLDSIGDMARHVLARMPERAILAGHSMGGRVALEVFSQAPGRVAGLVLANTGVHPATTEEPRSRQRLVDLARNEGMAALAAEWLPPMMGAAPGRIAQLMPDLTAMVEANSPASFAGQIAALLARPDARPALARVDVPLLLMSAEHDRWSPPAQHEAMLEIAPHGELTIIPDAGHMVPVEAPGPVAAAIGRWIEAQWPAAGKAPGLSARAR